MTELAVFAGVVGGMLDGLLFRGEPAFDEKGRKTAPMPKASDGLTAIDLFRKQYPGINPDYVYVVTRRPLAPSEKEVTPPTGVLAWDRSPVNVPEVPAVNVPAVKTRKNPRRPKYAYQILTRAIETLKRDERFKRNQGQCWTVLGIMATESLNLDSEVKTSTGPDYDRIMEVLKSIKDFNTGDPIALEEALSILHKARRMVR